MNTLNITIERKVQILARKLVNKLQEIIQQILYTHAELTLTTYFSVANKCNKQLIELSNKAVYYITVANNLANKYPEILSDAYYHNIKDVDENTPKCWREEPIYPKLVSVIKDVNCVIKLIY